MNLPNQRRWLALAFALISLPGFAHAQAEKKDAKTAPPAATKGATDPALRKPPGEHVVYIPYGKLADVFEKDPQNVLLPFQEYQRLWETFKTLGSTLARPPVPAVVSSLKYLGEVKGDIATIQATLSVDVLEEGWVKLEIPLQGVAVAKVEGGLLTPHGVGQYLLILPERGKHEVRFTLTAPVERTPQGRSLKLRGPLAGGTALELSIPEDNLAVGITPALAATEYDKQKGKTVIRTVIGAADELSIAWRPKTDMIAEKSLAFAASEMLVDLSDGVVHTTAIIDYQPLRGSLHDLKFTFPVGEQLLEIQAPGMRDWKVATEGQLQVVTVHLHTPAEKVVRLIVNTERPIPNGVFAVGSVSARDVERQSGVITVFGGDALSVNVADRQNITRVAAVDVPAGHRRPGAVHYKFYSGDYRLAVKTSAVEPRIAVVGRWQFRLEEGRLSAEGRLTYEIQQAGVFSVRIKLPANVEVDEVSSDNMERYETATEEGQRYLAIHFSRKSIGVVNLRVDYHLPRPDPNAPLDLPILEPQNAAAERGWIELLAQESFEVTGDPQRTKNVRPATPQELQAEGMANAPGERFVLASALRYLSRPVEAGFAVKQRKTRLLADVFSLIRVKENSIATETTIVYDVQFAPADVLELLVPQAVADRVEITGPNIKEKKRGEPAEGMVPWKIALHARAVGRYPIKISFLEPIALGADAKDAAKTIASEVKIVRPVGIERENGQIAITKERALAVDATADEQLEPIDPRLLQIPSDVSASTEGIDLAYRYYRHPVKLKLVVTKHDIQRVVETIITRALIQTVVPEKGPLTYQAQYTLRSSQRQRLAIGFPEGVRFLGVNVSGKSVLPEKVARKEGGAAYLFNVNRPTGNDEPFPMTILYEIPRPDDERLQVMTLQPFQLPALAMSAPQFEGDVAFQRLYWRVFLPQRYIASGRPDGFTDENSSWERAFGNPKPLPGSNNEVNQWLSEWRQMAGSSTFEFSTIGRPFLYGSLIAQPQLTLHYGYEPAIKTVASLIAFAVMCIALPLRFGAKITVVLAAAFLAALFALFHPETVAQWVASSWIGVAFALIIWVMFERRRYLLTHRDDDNDSGGTDDLDVPIFIDSPPEPPSAAKSATPETTTPEKPSQPEGSP